MKQKLTDKQKKPQITPQQEFMRYSPRIKNFSGMMGIATKKAFSIDEERRDWYL